MPQKSLSELDLRALRANRKYFPSPFSCWTGSPMVKKTCIEAIHDHVDQAGRSIGFATKDSRSWYWQFGTSVGVRL